MTAITTTHALPGTGRIARLRQQAATIASRAVMLADKARTRYRSSFMTVAGIAAIDTAAWQVNAGIGWLTTGVSILLYDAFGREKPPAKAGEKP